MKKENREQFSERQLAEYIQIIAGTYNIDLVHIVTCEVLSVDETERTCDVIQVSGKADTKIEGVSLSLNKTDGLLQIPKVGSQVKVSYSKENNPFVIVFTDIDKFYVRTEPGGYIQLGDGSLDGLVKVSSLVTDLNNQLTALKAAITAGYTAQSGVDGSAGLNAWNAAKGNAAALSKSSIENTSIKQGV